MWEDKGWTLRLWQDKYTATKTRTGGGANETRVQTIRGKKRNKDRKLITDKTKGKIEDMNRPNLENMETI